MLRYANGFLFLGRVGKRDCGGGCSLFFSDDGEDGSFWKWIFMEFCNWIFDIYFFFHMYFCLNSF